MKHHCTHNQRIKVTQIPTFIFLCIAFGLTNIIAIGTPDPGSQSLDIGLFTSDCASFEVKVKPGIDFTNSTLTNLQFTLKWPENSVPLVGFDSEYNLQQQGPVFIENGYNYAVFVTTSAIPINWVTGEEYLVLSFSHDQSGSGYADFIIAEDDWSVTNNGAYYIEVLGTDETGIIYHNADNVFLETCGKIDLGLFNPECGKFEVIALPHSNFLNSTLTNIQFTISWPANTVECVDFISDYDLVLQGPVTNYDGLNYAVFVSTSAIAIDWELESEYILLSFSHDQSGDGYGDFNISDDEWAQANNAVHYIEVLGLDKTGQLYHQAQNTYLGTCGVIDIGLFESDCGKYEVRVKPHNDYISTSLTNIQFTIKWPAETIDLTNIQSDYDIAGQGSVIEENGSNYLVFAGATAIPINWESEVEQVVLSFDRTNFGNGSIDIEISEDEWTSSNNGVYYLEILGLNQTGLLYQNTINTYVGPCGSVEIKVFLQGPYNTNTGLMNTAINSEGNIPLTQPYNTLPWEHNGIESISTIPTDMVDWVLVELRTETSEASTLERMAALLLSDGRIVQFDDPTQGVLFENIEPGNSYYIVVWHRNHMPVMTGLPVNLPNDGLPYDFTEASITQPYKHNDPFPSLIELEVTGSGVFGMIAGDINMDGSLKYLGQNNDRALILNKISTVSGLPYLNTTIEGYYNDDLNLDNTVKYLGTLNDRAIILSNISKLTGSNYLNTIYYSVVPGAID